MAEEKVREAVGVFHNEADLQSAANELLIRGFDRSHLSLLASDHAVEEKLGHAYKRVAELEDDPEVPSLAYAGSDSRIEAEGVLTSGLAYVGAIGTVGAIVASGGTVAVALIGAAIAGGAGGLIGVVLSRNIEHGHAHEIQEHLDHGGLLLWVRTIDEEHEKRACEILKRAGAEDVHVHDLPDIAFAREGGGSPPRPVSCSGSRARSVQTVLQFHMGAASHLPSLSLLGVRDTRPGADIRPGAFHQHIDQRNRRRLKLRLGPPPNKDWVIGTYRPKGLIRDLIAAGCCVAYPPVRGLWQSRVAEFQSRSWDPRY